MAKILLEKKLLDLKHVSTFVLDEADKVRVRLTCKAVPPTVRLYLATVATHLG